MERALETSSGTFFVATGPSARSTFVRRWPSGLPEACIIHPNVSVTARDIGEVGRVWEVTYVCGSVFLLGARDGAGALGGVEGGLALDGGFALGGAGAADFAADFGD